MATVYQQLWTGTNGAAWPDFSADEGSAVDIQGNMGRLLTPATGFTRAKANYNVPSIPQDFVMTVDVLLQAGTDNDWYMELAIRGGSASYNNQWIFNSWQIQYNPGVSAPQLYNVDGTGANNFLTTFSTEPLPVIGDTIHWKIAPLGSDFRMKIWKNAQSEPASYETFTDTGTVPSGGRVMFGCVQGGTASPALDIRWDNLLIDDGVSGQPTVKRLGGIPFAGGARRGRW